MDRECENPAGGLRLFNSDRPITRSVTRALENQIVGFLFTQIDTGIPHPADFVPIDYFNRCSARIFRSLGSVNNPSNSNDQVQQSEESCINSFERKLKNLWEMSDEEQRDASGHDDQGTSVRRSAAERQKAPGSEPASTAPNVDQLSQLMAMMMQQQALMATCVNEVRNMRSNMSDLSNRVTDMEASAQALSHRSAVASTPENPGHSNEA
ncbi:uncharacterized protein LOC110117789 [Ceratitis capitata]|uniref:uncharacterized protein LOC110117789 n=1 Tax=Ceratitis capitata TaxID=7213 RepID=UPI000A107543|nr:uncharacterized protein LOC110117789 [Ceratitis capitata]